VGGLFWQLLAEGMDSFQDGYGVVLSESSSTVGLIAEESQKLIKIRKMYARLRNIEKWKQAREIGRAQWWSGNKVNDTRN
jgi:mannan endo-1,4-beta-mannosidase